MYMRLAAIAAAFISSTASTQQVRPSMEAPPAQTRAFQVKGSNYNPQPHDREDDVTCLRRNGTQTVECRSLRDWRVIASNLQRAATSSGASDTGYKSHEGTQACRRGLVTGSRVARVVCLADTQWDALNESSRLIPLQGEPGFYP